MRRILVVNTDRVTSRSKRGSSVSGSGQRLPRGKKGGADDASHGSATTSSTPSDEWAGLDAAARAAAAQAASSAGLSGNCGLRDGQERAAARLASLAANVTALGEGPGVMARQRGALAAALTLAAQQQRLLRAAMSRKAEVVGIDELADADADGDADGDADAGAKAGGREITRYTSTGDMSLPATPDWVRRVEARKKPGNNGKAGNRGHGAALTARHAGSISASALTAGRGLIGASARRVGAPRDRAGDSGTPEKRSGHGIAVQGSTPEMARGSDRSGASSKGAFHGSATQSPAARAAFRRAASPVRSSGRRIRTHGRGSGKRGGSRLDTNTPPWERASKSAVSASNGGDTTSS